MGVFDTGMQKMFGNIIICLLLSENRIFSGFMSIVQIGFPVAVYRMLQFEFDAAALCLVNIIVDLFVEK